jgi:hypothetical protein
MHHLVKPMLFALITVFGIALTIVPAHAQSGSRASANISFDFSIGRTRLKAGSYTVEQLQSGIITFSSEDEKEHQFALTVPGDSDEETQKPHLIFIRYGSEAFLKRVFLSGNEDCRELPESSRERELIKNQASGAEAFSAHPASTLIVVTPVSSRGTDRQPRHAASSKRL